MKVQILNKKWEVKEKEFEQILKKHPKIVLYFYPKDNTSWCTKEAKEFTELWPEFEKLGWIVIGVSKDSIESHKKFREKHNLWIPLISDPELVLHKKFGARGTKKRYGKEVEWTIRSTFLIKDGQVILERKNVKASGEAQKVLDIIKEQNL